MYSFTSVFHWEITSSACLPEQQMLECLTELRNSCEDTYQDDSNEQAFLTALRLWTHDLPSVLLRAQTSPNTLDLSSYDGRVWIQLAINKLGHYEFELLDDLGSDRYVAKITWINPII